MKNYILILISIFLVACSTLAYDPVEYDRVVGLYVTVDEIQKMCPQENRHGIAAVILTYKYQLEWLDTYAKNIKGNSDLYRIVRIMQKDADAFLEIAKEPNMNAEYCKLRADIAKEGITKTLKALGVRRTV